MLRIILRDLEDYSFVTELLKRKISFRLNEQSFSMKPEDDNVEFKILNFPCLHLGWTYRKEIGLSFVAKVRNSPFDITHSYQIGTHQSNYEKKTEDKKEEKEDKSNSQPKDKEKMQVR